MKIDNNKVLTLLYKNWKGQTSIRKVQPIGNMYWGQTEYYKQDQWLFDVWDLDKDAPRTYAMNHIIQILNNEI